MDANPRGPGTPAGARRREYRGPRRCPPCPRLPGRGSQPRAAPPVERRHPPRPDAQSRGPSSATRCPLARDTRAPGPRPRWRTRDFRRECGEGRDFRRPRPRRRPRTGLPAQGGGPGGASGGLGSRRGRSFRRCRKCGASGCRVVGLCRGGDLVSGISQSVAGAVWLGTDGRQRSTQLALGVGGLGGGGTGECPEVIFCPGRAAPVQAGRGLRAGLRACG